MPYGRDDATDSARQIWHVPTVDLSADLGEGCAYDQELLELVTSASISCGAHAGDAHTIRAAIDGAVRRGVSIGAHPGYPDRDGFGRRETGASPREIERLVQAQLLTFAEACAAAGATCTHVKAHGALYNRSMVDDGAAESITRATLAVDPSLAVLCMPGSRLLLAAEAAGLRVAREAFLDRAYESPVALVARDQPGAMIVHPEMAAARARQMVVDRVLTLSDGSSRELHADSLCVHGDSPGAVALLRAVRDELIGTGVTVRAFVHS